MKNVIILAICLSFVPEKVQSQVKLIFDEFGLEFYPNKCIDTLGFSIKKGKYEGDTVKLYLNSCKGDCYVEILNKKSKVKVTGYYVGMGDTLRRYNNAKIMGKPKGEYWYQVRILKYFNPLPCKIWRFFDDKMRVLNEVNYQYEIGNVIK